MVRIQHHLAAVRQRIDHALAAVIDILQAHRDQQVAAVLVRLEHCLLRRRHAGLPHHEPVADTVGYRRAFRPVTAQDLFLDRRQPELLHALGHTVLVAGMYSYAHFVPPRLARLSKQVS